MSDQYAREHAVDVSRSVLVQAPAGSGKTTLLVERYIGLLATVEAPESILAITFTRKAAAEMRRRILQILTPGHDQWEAHEHGLKTKVAAIADRIEAWSLLENPQRMQIRTIDGFCHSLTKAMPVVGQLGPVPQPADQPQKLYRQAARQALRSDPQDSEMERARQNLLAWCDHNAFQVESWIAKLLSKREQWLKLIMPGGHFDRERQNAYLAHCVEQTLAQAHSQLKASLENAGVEVKTFLGCLAEAGHEIKARGADSPISHLAGITTLPSASAASINLWRGLGEALVKQDGHWRSAPNTTQGFSKNTPHKQAIDEILDDLREDTALAALLREAADQPEPAYSDQDWSMLESLVAVLRRAAQHLELVFAQAGQSDFTAIATAAIRGLGNDQTGFSDLALYLDSQIEHILVDEYQDTNHPQYQLLEKLIQGWAGEPHRTLFLVGDPMQSIYRFREAEVGLFIQTRDQGIGPVIPESAQLSENFRSSPSIVDWVNSHLGPLFPLREDIASGAIAYARSESHRALSGQVTVQPFPNAQAEAEAIADHIQSLLQTRAPQKDYKIAIIVRARSHLNAILPTLRRRDIPFRALKLDKLIERPAIQDLLALTQAMMNPQNRTAVLAVMRSPLAGLTLSELSQLTKDCSSSLNREALIGLSEDATARAEKVFDVLEKAQQQVGRRPLSELVEGAWLQLGGPALASDPTGQPAEEIETYFNALAHAENSELLQDWNDFIEWLAQSHTKSDGGGEQLAVDVVTMHGAKGLEWDAVIIPSLQSQGNRSQSDLLYWLPLSTDDNEEAVLMAPMDAPGRKNPSPLVKLIKKADKHRQTYEALRLMYVATTRAKSDLLISAVIQPNQEGDFKPAQGTLLETVWPTLHAYFSHRTVTEDTAPSTDPEAASIEASPDQHLYRLPRDFQPDYAQALSWTPPFEIQQRAGEVEFNWAGTQARRSGTVLHQLLEVVGQTGIEALTEADLQRLIDSIPKRLRSAGTHQEALKKQTAQTESAFMGVLESPTGQWILSGGHRNAACEYPISGVLDGRLIQGVVDRTFIDQIGQRWIIDYKSGHHAGGDLEGFLEQEADRYREQLSIYRRLFAQLSAEPITTALYLPRHDRLKVVE